MSDPLPLWPRGGPKARWNREAEGPGSPKVRHPMDSLRAVRFGLRAARMPYTLDLCE